MDAYTALDNFVIFNLGLVTPVHRFVAGWLATTGVIWTVQPKSMFTDGIPRSWNITSSGSEVVEPTSIPWYLPGVVSGAALGLFI